MSGDHSILVYVSKSSIYNGSFKSDFESYIHDLPNVIDKEAIEIIRNISHFVGADKPEHNSTMVELLRKGVVIHHGSIPLAVRFLIEDFIRKKHSSLCFATSTLAQGINMPFDIVWLVNNRHEGNESERSLAFKNLIGRAGRLTASKQFDYGYVFTNNAKLFTQRINTQYYLNDKSVLDYPNADKSDSDQNELINSIQNNIFDDEKNIPMSKVKRLSDPLVIDYVRMFLQKFYRVPNDVKASIGGFKNKVHRDVAKNLLRLIYQASLGRNLFQGEEYVFNQAIDIFFHTAQDRSFSEIVGLRYNSIHLCPK